MPIDPAVLAQAGRSLGGNTPFGSNMPGIQQWGQQNAQRRPMQQRPHQSGSTGPGAGDYQSYQTNATGQLGQYGGQRQQNYGNMSGAAPDLGTVSELLRWQRQTGGDLAAMGMAPEISSTQYGQHNAGSRQTGMGLNNQTNNLFGGGSSGFQNQLNRAGGNTIEGPGPRVSGYVNGQAQYASQAAPGFGVNPSGQGVPSAPGFGLLTGGGQQQGGFEMNLQNTIQQMLQNPTGYTPGQQAMMRTRAGDSAAGQQSINAQRIQEDAVRRGAYGSAGGDADIRDQLNRSNAQGAADQQRAVQDVDFGLADLGRQGRQGAAALGTGLLGEQFKNQNSMRELVMMLEALKSSMGGQGGLNMILGGA